MICLSRLWGLMTNLFWVLGEDELMSASILKCLGGNGKWDPPLKFLWNTWEGSSLWNVRNSNDVSEFNDLSVWTLGVNDLPVWVLGVNDQSVWVLEKDESLYVSIVKCLEVNGTVSRFENFRSSVGRLLPFEMAGIPIWTFWLCFRVQWPFCLDFGG